mmetsp:Transcript_2153/g.2454  ORF Transcript_2153/g.2454 Transcript_2153/m.2454 type:complete len:184 (+) Transcript_2153:89-640(+)
MRELKYHEQKLLKKVDFLNYKRERTLQEIRVTRQYHLQNREDYMKYSRIVGQITKLTAKLKALDSRDPFRISMTEQLLEKLYSMGIIPTKKNLSISSKVTVSAFCRRRLPIVLVRLKFAETVKQAITLIEAGHVRVGPEVVTDPAFLVTRSLEDYISWVDTSKIKRHVMKYNDKLDDYDLLMA